MEHNWGLYIEIARRFEHKAQFQDREDLRHSIIIEIAEAKSKNGDKPFTEATMCRTASYVVADYYRGLRLPLGNLPCGRCSKAQRAKCHKDDLYSQCRKGVEVVRLNSQIQDGEGNSIELIDTLADDSAIDLDGWLDARVWLLGRPRRLIQIAYNKVKGIPLDNADMIYLCKWRQKAQKKALLRERFCPFSALVLVGAPITACGVRRGGRSLIGDSGSLAHYLTILNGEGLRNNLISRAGAQVQAL